MGKRDLLKNYIIVPIEKLVAADWNYKIDDTAKAKFMMDKLKSNLKRNGQIENIIIRELDTGFFEVVNGNHRYMALKDLGWTECVAYNLGAVDLPTAKRIAVATNETKFENDPLRLAGIVKELAEGVDPVELESVLADLPYSAEEMLNQVQVLDFDWEGAEGKKDSDGASSSDGADDQDWKTVSFRLPEGVAEQLQDQIHRFKKALYPDEDPKDVKDVLPIEAMVQCLAQLSDDQLV